MEIEHVKEHTVDSLSNKKVLALVLHAGGEKLAEVRGSSVSHGIHGRKGRGRTVSYRFVHRHILSTTWLGR